MSGHMSIGPSLLELSRISHRSDDEYWKDIQSFVSELEKACERASSDQLLDRLVELSESHDEWPVRAAIVRLLSKHFVKDERAQVAIAAATHDPVDWVAFTAIQVAGADRLRIAIRDLIGISGWPSNFTRPDYLRKPVGCGAAFTKRALLEIFGSQDSNVLRALEDSHFADMRRSVLTTNRSRTFDDVVYVPGGPFIAGRPNGIPAPAAAAAFQMDAGDNSLRVVELDGFYIDRLTVTNSRYREFLDDVGNDTKYDHPDQEPRQSHRPAHWHDPRFNQDGHPVVGVDWYDAWAFARWAGGTLPSENEWEKAARGTDGRQFPWGNEFDPDRVNYVERAYDVEVRSLTELEQVLVGTTTDTPRCPVLSADDLESGASPYGLLQMSGNVWELTRTNFFSRQDMDPHCRGRRPIEFMNRPEAFHVLRGGTWTSPPICLTTYYRGKDLITDKHNEVGFRCSYPQ